MIVSDLLQVVTCVSDRISGTGQCDRFLDLSLSGISISSDDRKINGM
ncbi:hypothetical protein [Moorena bouillonii]|nr:hypothetical protein [Moorena bouillonii]